MDTILSEPMSDEDLHVQEILLAASCHDLETLQRLIELYEFSECRAVDVQDSETGFSPLHACIAACETDDEDSTKGNGMSGREELLEGGRDTIKFLLENGAIWNQLDKNDETPGCIAGRLKLKELYDLMVDAGVRAELLLNRLEGYEELKDEDEDEQAVDDQEGTEEDEKRPIDNDQVDVSHDVVDSRNYLSSTLSLSGDKLVDEHQNGVMMAWEADIMSKSADAILYKAGLRVLNIGFGMGIIDMYIQGHKNKPSSHHIVEAHPDVLADMRAKKWYETSGTVIHAGKWQDILPQLLSQGQTFDAIYFDTFAESYGQFREFFSEHVIGLLEQDGRWSFFNGMGADRQIIYDVYQKVVEMDLFESGFDVDWQEIEVPELEKEWEGIKRRYWDVESYRLPVCRFMD
jgi:type IV protein arginine methyltransferase